MLYLHGMGHAHPDNVISNRFLEDLDIGTTREWILERVGIETRRTVLPLDYIRETKNRDPRMAYEVSACSNARSGAAAAYMALERAGIGPADVGLVISGSSAPDTLTPAEAATIAAQLGIDAPCFDLNSACTTFGMQLHFLERMRPETLPPYTLIVTPENVTRCVDYSDRAVAVLFGDGSAAAVVSTAVPSRVVVSDCCCDSKPSVWQKATIPRIGYFRQDGSAVQGFAIRRMTLSLQTLQPLCSGNGNGGRFLFIGHQANVGMLRMVCERAGISDDHHWQNVANFGNTGSAGAPSVLSQHWKDLRKGDHVAMALVGAGLTWVHLLLTVGGDA